MIKKILALGIILAIAFFLRFYQLGINPPSLTWDEAAWGYNAYSLGIDGKDEFGRFLPLDYLESFGDFKPPVYAYLSVFPVKIFGLNEFAVRFPSALFGVLTVLVTYFLVKRIFRDSRIKESNAEVIALISAFLLAVSPWHINLSRAAFEANVATFFIVSGVWLFLSAVQNKKWLLIFSAASFVLSVYTFNTARIVSPFLILALSVGHRKQLIKMKKEVFLASIIGFLLLLPTLKFLFSSQASLRFKEVNIFSDISVVKTANQEIENDNNAWWSKIIHNRRVLYGREFIKHYFDNLNPGFLFIKGDGNPKFSTQDVGQLLLFDFPFLIIGALYLFRKRERNWWIIPLWLLFGIIPSATARETPHALRIETVIPTLQIIIAYGFVKAFTLISNIKYQIAKIQIKYLIFSSCILLFIFNFLYYLHGYYAHYPKEFSSEWQYGYKDSINYVKSIQDKYDKISFTDKLGRPYIYFLFYLRYDPDKFRSGADISRDVFGFVHVNSFDKYEFPDSENPFTTNKNTILVEKGDIMSGKEPKERFKLLNGDDWLGAYE